MNAKNVTVAQLWLALRFEHFPINACGIGSDEPYPIIITEKQYVIYANQVAREAGIVNGMDVTTATLLCDCTVQARDLEQEQRALALLTDELYQFSPYIEPYINSAISESGLLLEISRCLQLFGGTVSLVEKIFSHLVATPFSCASGLAHSGKAAWLLSYDNYPITGTENKETFVERLHRVPIQRLYDYPQTIEALEKTGFHTLGDIARQINTHSIASIKKRFGVQFADALSDIFLIEHNLQQKNLFERPRPVYTPKDIFFETLQFDYPISQVDQLQQPMDIMLQKLTAYLYSRQLECKHIEWKLYDIYHNSKIINVYSDTAQSQGNLLYELTLIQLEQQQLTFEVDTVDLLCRDASPVNNRDQLLDFNNTGKYEHHNRNFAITAAKLKARLGNQALFKLSYYDSYLPEISQQTIAINDTSNQHLPSPHNHSIRPQWLLSTPSSIEERNQGLNWRGHLTILQGPERIHGHWWDKSTARDYFLAQRQDQLRLWIFQDLKNHCWYVHGIFG